MYNLIKRVHNTDGTHRDYLQVRCRRRRGAGVYHRYPKGEATRIAAEMSKCDMLCVVDEHMGEAWAEYLIQKEQQRGGGGNV